MNKRKFFYTFLFLLAIECLSFSGWVFPLMNNTVFWLLFILAIALSVRSLRFGLYLALIELVIGSFGYMFSYSFGAGGTVISLRLAIFFAVFFVWLARFLLSQDRWQCLSRRLKEFPLASSYIALAIVIIWGFVWGVTRNDFNNVFFDFNNWLFFLYFLPLLYAYREKKFWQDLLHYLIPTLFWIFLKTFFLLYLFSHSFYTVLPEIYRWIRDTRVGEITKFSDNFYRIFIQSQIYSLLALIAVIPFCLYKIKSFYKTNLKNYIFWLFVFSLCVVIISFSRSFWVGAIVATFAYLFIFLIHRPVFITRFVILLFISSLFFAVISYSVIKAPPGFREENLGSLVSDRATNVTEAAGSSRINMIRPLVTKIIEHPVIGSGFGSIVTYNSVDPRILVSTAGASGEYTTYAFEWSYLDMLLEFGLAGLIVYLFLFYKIFRLGLGKNIFSSVFRRPFPLSLNSLNFGLLIALLALLAVNFFTPYLNHPLGIAPILFISFYFAYSADGHRPQGE